MRDPLPVGWVDDLEYGSAEPPFDPSKLMWPTTHGIFGPLRHSYDSMTCVLPSWAVLLGDVGEMVIDSSRVLGCDSIQIMFGPSGDPLPSSGLTYIGTGYFRRAYRYTMNGTNETADARSVAVKPPKPIKGCSFFGPIERRRLGSQLACARLRERHALEASILNRPLLRGNALIAGGRGGCGAVLVAEFLPMSLEGLVRGEPPVLVLAHLPEMSEKSLLPSLTLALLARDCATSLALLHAAGVAHTDIRLSQFLLRARPSPAAWGANESGRGAMAVLNDLNRARVLKHRVTVGESALHLLDADGSDHHGNQAERCPFDIVISHGKWRSPEELRGGQVQQQFISRDCLKVGLATMTLL